VQAPTIYRLFGDKDGLLEAVLVQVMAEQVAGKSEQVRAASENDVDPVDDLRVGWRQQIAFGLANPALFRLLSDPERVSASPAAQAGIEVLRHRIHRVALAGRLRVSEETAVALVHAAGVGVIQTLLAAPPDERDGRIGDDMGDAVLRQILTDAPPVDADGVVAAAITLRAAASRLSALSDGERRLLDEWLGRLV
jgi:AcrR family transcriptional regulator